jgi:alkaline phosphatase D
MREKDIPNLIVGHIGSDHARIWVRGSVKGPVAFLSYKSEGGQATQLTMLLQERHAYTGVFELKGLSPATAYSCEASFGQAIDDPPAKRIAPRYNTGYFRTAPPEGSETKLCFIFGSCNLHSLGIVSSPDPAYRRIGEMAQEKKADFMLHCGDQIYYDMPIPDTSPTIDQYRDKYLDAWGDCEPAAQLLTMLPNYMILDDHEILDDFSNDKEVRFGHIEYVKTVSLKAYREFQHIHNPQSYGPAPLYYNFSFGQYRFFVMDIRTERFHNPPGNQMIGEPQLEDFFEWLQTYPNDIKFVVSSGPFVGEVRNSNDKWSGVPFRPQREEIIEFIAEHRIPNIIFLTGDRHNSYYASLKIAVPGGEDIIVHELMSSPINQLSKRGLNHYFPSLRSTTPNGVSYLSEINVESYYGTHSNFMVVEASGKTVQYEIYRTKKEKPPRRVGSFSLI